jgi:hypothetical protein
MPPWRTNVPSLAVITVRMVSTATRTVCEPLVRAKTRECTERAAITLNSFPKTPLVGWRMMQVPAPGTHSVGFELKWALLTD